MTSELVYSFGHFRLLPERRTLLAAEQPVKLVGRGFDLLATLVEHSDRVLSKDELLERVWPPLVVEENNLNVQILALRKLLGHPAISTVPGRGYRFALPVVQHGGPPRPVAAEAGVAVRAYPPMRGAAAEAADRPGNLPAHIPALYGRDEDLAIVAALLAERRLVTVAGAGGIGKTRLGQAVAAQRSSQHADGVWWVELAPVSQGTLVAAAVADVLGIDLSDGQDATRSLVAHLHDRHLLLVLDNCEQVLDAVAALAAAIGAAAPHLRLLVTSQEVLKAAGEQVYRLGSLSLPEVGAGLSVAAVAQSGAGALLVARARAVDSRFALAAANMEAVADICRRLDGIPLAIELAAARLFALERLASSGETDAILQRHVRAMVLLIESHLLRQAGERDRQAKATVLADQRLVAEIDNVRAAFEWLAQERPCAAELDTLAVEFGGLAGGVIALAGREHEAFERTLALRRRVNSATPLPLAARFWRRLGTLGAVAGHEASLDAAC